MPAPGGASTKAPLLMLTAVILHRVPVMALLAMLLMLLLRHMCRLLFSAPPPKSSHLPLLRGLVQLHASKLGGRGVTGRVEALTRT